LLLRATKMLLFSILKVVSGIELDLIGTLGAIGILPVIFKIIQKTIKIRKNKNVHVYISYTSILEYLFCLLL